MKQKCEDGIMALGRHHGDRTRIFLISTTNPIEEGQDSSNIALTWCWHAFWTWRLKALLADLGKFSHPWSCHYCLHLLDWSFRKEELPQAHIFLLIPPDDKILAPEGAHNEGHMG